VAEDQRTLHAQRAFDFSTTFAYRFGNVAFGAKTPRKLDLVGADAVSTAGGKQARQSVVLHPGSNDQNNIVVGFIDVPHKSCEIRSYAVTSQQFYARFRRTFDTTREEYEALVDDLQGFLRLHNFQVTSIESSASSDVPGDSGSGRRAPSVPASFWGMLAVMLLAGTLGGLLLGYLAFGLGVFR
jgi:hypothetical protein